MKITSLVVLTLLILACKVAAHRHRRRYNPCPQLESIVRTITWNRVAATPSLAAKLLRIHFHDCFVRGCDASILLDSTVNNTAEKAALPNLSLSGFEVIDEIKLAVEIACPRIVSCADILAIAARDAVSYQFQVPLWPVFRGRKDGRTSKASEALASLPIPSSNFTTLLNLFAENGLNLVDLVALSGAHTIGVGHCAVIASRLYNFSGKGDADPSLDPTYVNFLKGKCTLPPNPTTTVEMDPGSSLSFDTSYFNVVRQHKGLFQSDAALLTNPRAARIVEVFQNPRFFFTRFARSMVKMGSIGVRPVMVGEIRANCRVVN